MIIITIKEKEIQITNEEALELYYQLKNSLNIKDEIKVYREDTINYSSW